MNRTFPLAMFLLATTSLLAASSAVIVARRTDTATGNFVVYVPPVGANFRATVYLESPSGAEQTCASMSWFDDNNNPQTSANVCSDTSAKGGFVLPIRAKAGTNIFLNVNSAAGPIYTTLERF